jgi:hypothetical protein
MTKRQCLRKLILAIRKGEAVEANHCPGPPEEAVK